MNWRKLVGRILTAAVAVALVIFAATGTTPTWWEAALGMAVPIINILIGEWKPPA